MIETGYPSIFIYLVLVIGFVLVLFRPYKAFLLVVVLLAAGNAAMFNQTRTVTLGPYLNLGDACLLVAIVALFFDRYRSKKPLRVPQVVPLILFALTISASILIVETSFQSLYKGQPLFGTIYNMLRQRGFAYVGSENPVRNPKDGSILQCDSVFCKGDLRTKLDAGARTVEFWRRK